MIEKKIAMTLGENNVSFLKLKRVPLISLIFIALNYCPRTFV